MIWPQMSALLKGKDAGRGQSTGAGGCQVPGLGLEASYPSQGTAVLHSGSQGYPTSLSRSQSSPNTGPAYLPMSHP